MNKTLFTKDLLKFSVASLGVVFGDIGTSVLYTYQECFHGGHAISVTHDHVVGVASLIIWALLLVVTLKYVWILMNAENKGEGGILSLLSLAPPKYRLNSKGVLIGASLMAVAGAALLYGDGIITPAISVLSAMEGLETINPAYSKYIVPMTLVILFALFSVQKKGTGGIGNYFGYVVLAWFLVMAGLGVYHIFLNPSILIAFNPYYAILVLTDPDGPGISILGAVILAVTGGEALYADMGHFGKKPIRYAWHGIVLPALVLNYLGQGAMILTNPSSTTRTFYAMLPTGPWSYALIALATAATIIASQALITGAFSLTHQAIRLGIFPRVKLIHTSADLEGRVYLPFINWMLAVCCMATVIFFERSNRLAAAYGLAVSGTMLLTTVVFFYVAHYRWKWSLWKILPLTVFLVFLDGAFLLANLPKIPDGGYLPLVIGSVFFSIMIIWQKGRARLSMFYKTTSKTMDDFFEEVERRQIQRVPGTLVVLASNENRTPPVLGRLVDTMHVIQQHVLLVTVTTSDDPYVPATERIRTTSLKHGVTRVLLNFGFMETPDLPAALEQLNLTHLKSFDPKKVVYLLGRETFLVDSQSFISRVRQVLFALMSRNATSASDYFNLPAKQVLELGSQISA